jgi:hypothetical protein
MQIVATLVSTFVCTAILNFQIGLKMCALRMRRSGLHAQASTCFHGRELRMTRILTQKECSRSYHSFQSQAVFWGTIDPHKMFGPGGQYTKLLIGFPVGFIIPIIVYFAMKRFPRLSWIRQIHPIPLIAGGLA